MISRLIFVALAALAAPASAATLNANVVLNGDAETGDTSGWLMNTGVIAVGAAGTAPTAPIGTYSFTGEFGATLESMSQSFDLTPNAALVDAGSMLYSLSAQLQNRVVGSLFDTVTLTLDFRDAVAAVLSTVVLTDPSAPDSVFDWNGVVSAGTVPVDTRSAVVTLWFQRTGGSSTDAYADEVSLVFTDAAQVPLPAPVLMLGAGLGLLALRRKRRG